MIDSTKSNQRRAVICPPQDTSVIAMPRDLPRELRSPALIAPFLFLAIVFFAIGLLNFVPRETQSGPLLKTEHAEHWNGH
jgi:hypothetical protein